MTMTTVKSAIRTIVAVAALFGAATCFAAIAKGIAVTALPEPDETGAYVFGDREYTAVNFFDSTLPPGLPYPVWEKILVPSGAKLKFVGGVVLSSLPDGCTFDFFRLHAPACHR